MFKIILCLIALISVSANVKANDTADISNNSLVNIEEITVISSRAPIPLSEVIGSVSVIKSDDIEKRIANNIVDLIENTIGVSAPRSDGYGRIFNEGFRIRGLGGKRVNVLIDGVRIPQ